MVTCSKNDVVLITGFRVGIVRYRGNIIGHNNNNIFVGIEIFMTDSQNGNCDGSYNGQRYFQCDIKRGIFIQETKIQRIITSEELLNKLVKINEEKKLLQEENKRYEVMADLYLKKSIEWKESLKNLEIAHDELQTEIEFLKYELMLKLSDDGGGGGDDDNDDDDENKNDPFQMISNNNLSELEIYLSSNEHIINAFNDKKKGNLAIWSIKNNNIKALNILYKFNCDLDLCDDLGWSPLIYSCIYNNYKIAKLLILKYKCNIEILDYGCWSCVIFCCILNNDKILSLLAKNNANLDRFIYANKNPLIICAERGYFKCLKVLKNNNVDLMDAINIVKQSNHKEMTPINRKKSIQILSS